MLSQRYADPFPVVDMMIENEMLPEFIDNLIEQINEDKLWQLYLAVALTTDKPFDVWKADVLQDSNQEKYVSESRNGSRELPPEQAIAQAESILSGFMPF